MNSETSAEETQRSCGAPSSVTPSTAILNRKLGISPAPRMLTRSEIDLLRQSAKEIAQSTREALAREGSTRNAAAFEGVPAAKRSFLADGRNVKDPGGCGRPKGPNAHE